MTAQTESDPPRRTSVSLRLLAVSVGLPMVIVLIDQQVIAACETMFKLRAFLPILFVAQVGVLAACAGRFVENAFLRFVVFAWSLALVDSLAVAHLYFGNNIESQCLVFAMLSGQFGLLTIWGMMNPLPWPIRIPILFATLVLLVLLLLQASGSSPWRNETQMWAVILSMQSMVVVIICTILRSRGYRLLKHAVIADDAQTAGRAQLQFSIKHIILWTTIVAPILVMAKGIQWVLLGFLDLYWSAELAVATGAVTFVAVFAALGANRLVTRLAVLLVVPPLMGLVLRWATLKWSVNWGSSRASWMFMELKGLGYVWILWCVLAAWFLAASLLVFRASGYQLVRARTARVE